MASRSHPSFDVDRSQVSPIGSFRNGYEDGFDANASEGTMSGMAECLNFNPATNPPRPIDDDGDGDVDALENVNFTDFDSCYGFDYSGDRNLTAGIIPQNTNVNGVACPNTLDDEAGIDCGGLCPDECPSCAPVTKEAEVMFHSTGGPDPDGWNIWDNGYISTTHTFADQETRVTIRARGDEALGVWPHMLLRVGGTIVGDVFVTTSSWQDYSFDFTPQAGSQEVRVEFDNDYYAPPHDRNLYVDKATFECAPSCTDGVINGTETDVDCGGSQCPTCPDGASCTLATDCESQNCANGSCQPSMSIGYGFESGVSGWANMDWPAIATSTVSSPVFAGTKSLEVTVQSTGAGAPRVWVVPATSPPAGSNVTFHVYFPAGAPIYAVQPYVADQNWTWHDSWTGSPPTGSWRTLTVELPSNFAGPAREVGIKVYLNGDVTSYDGAFYVDEVGW